MSKNNTILIKNEELTNVIIISDCNGHNEIDLINSLECTRLVTYKNPVSLPKKNTIYLNDEKLSDTIIKTDNSGNNTIEKICESHQKTIDLNAEDIFKEVLSKNKKFQLDITKYLEDKRASLLEILQKATKYYKTKNFLAACELYESALQTIQLDNYPDEFLLDNYDILAIKLALTLSKIALYTLGSLQTAEYLLQSLIREYGSIFPSLYYYLAKVHYELNNYSQAKTILEDGLEMLKNAETSIAINWPADEDKMVVDTEKPLSQSMLTLLNQCKISHLPDAECYFSFCEVGNRNIYFRSPNFMGYVKVECSNKCRFAYHKNCWKKKLKFGGIKKANIFIDTSCETSDCGGLIEKIIIYDKNMSITTTIAEKSVSTSTDTNIHQKKIDSKENTCLFEPPLRPVSKNSKPENNDKNNHNSLKNNFNSDLLKLDDNSETKTDIHVNPIKNKSVLELAEISKLNSAAKEFFPAETEVQNNKILPLKENVINMYEDDEFTENYVYSRYVPLRRPREVIQRDFVKIWSDKCSQTSENVYEEEIENLKYKISVLQSKLLQSEETNKNLITQIQVLENGQNLNKVEKSTNTDVNSCENCSELIKKLEIKSEECSEKATNIGALQSEIVGLNKELSNVKTSSLLERECFNENQQKWIFQNESLKKKLCDSGNSQEAMRKEFEEYRRNNNFPELKNMMLHQINFIKSVYLNYISMFENKCKHMIWELEDLTNLTSTETLPSKAEVEENCNCWKQALSNATNNRTSIVTFYENLFRKFSGEQYYENFFAAPLPNLVPEPPSLILRHFKSMFIVNKRLENDLNRHMATFYKIISTPYPGMFPQFTNSSVVSRTETDLETVSGMNSELVELAIAPVAKTETLESRQLEIRNTNEIEETTETLDLASGVTQNLPTECEQNKPESTTKPVIGPDGLVLKLQQKFPLLAPHIFTQAVQILRETRGGLSGMDSKSIMLQLKAIIKELTAKERSQPGYERLNDKEKKLPQQPAWAKISNGVQWQNKNVDRNCTICFEVMEKKKSVQLRCQHIFHTICIKKWLQTDSICPICRSFTTLDDEFPPLK